MGNSDRMFKDGVYEHFSRIGKAISSPKRLELLDMLLQAEQTVEVLAKKTNLTVANASQHLKVLLAARMVESTKEGLYVRYRIADESVRDFLLSLRHLGENRLAEINAITRAFIDGHSEFEAVNCNDLIEKIQTGTALVLDVRPTDEYAAGHLPGALDVPLDELERYLLELPKDKEIIAYCRGPYCVLSMHAVELLKAKGFRAVRWEGGVQDWVSQGYPIESNYQQP